MATQRNFKPLTEEDAKFYNPITPKQVMGLAIITRFTSKELSALSAADGYNMGWYQAYRAGVESGEMPIDVLLSPGEYIKQRAFEATVTKPRRGRKAKELSIEERLEKQEKQANRIEKLLLALQDK